MRRFCELSWTGGTAVPNGARLFKRSGMEVGWDLCRGMGVVGGKVGQSPGVWVDGGGLGSSGGRVSSSSRRSSGTSECLRASTPRPLVRRWSNFVSKGQALQEIDSIGDGTFGPVTGLGPGDGLGSRVWTAKRDGELWSSRINKKPDRTPGR